MKSFFEWFENADFDKNKPWLILGKGPSFKSKDNFNLNDFHLLSLNHAVREQKVKIAHMIDFDVFETCAEAIEKNAEYVVMPWIPHIKNKPGSLTLDELVYKNPSLQKLNNQNRLLWYNLITAQGRYKPQSKIVEATFFSVEAALNLLAYSGVKTIRSLGIDGGNQYSKEFADLWNITRLNNGHKSFDQQFKKIAKTILNTQINYSPLNVESPIKVYVGTTEDQMLSVKVLEYSIRKNTSMNVEVYPMHLLDIAIPSPKEASNRPRTPFSFQRLTIPQLAEYKGKAIYLDSDMQVFKDLKDLWLTPFDGADILTVKEEGSTNRLPQFSVMLLDCNSLKWDINQIVDSLDKGDLTYEDLMYKFSIAKKVSSRIDSSWNSLEKYQLGQTSLIHYTDMPTQPWVSIDNDHEDIWMRDLFEAIDRNFISIDFVYEHVQKGYIRPSLIPQIENRFERAYLLSPKELALDSSFKAPYTQLATHKATKLSTIRNYKRTITRPLKSVICNLQNSYSKSTFSKLCSKLYSKFATEYT